MTYTKQFFDLQICFARKVAKLSGSPLAQVLLEYTNLYVRFGLGREFSAANPVWQRYLAGVDGFAADLETWTFDFYQSQLPERAAPLIVSSVGCFSYARLTSNCIRIHFHNADDGGHSPLATDRKDRRLAELRALFCLARKQEGLTPRVLGTSWLYNLPAYRQLFPDKYLISAMPTAPKFQNMPLWGQFVDRRGGVRQGIADEFVRRLAAASSLAELPHCFLLHVLKLEAPVAVFYEHYAV